MERKLMGHSLDMWFDSIFTRFTSLSPIIDALVQIMFVRCIIDMVQCYSWTRCGYSSIITEKGLNGIVHCWLQPGHRFYKSYIEMLVICMAIFRLQTMQEVAYRWQEHMLHQLFVTPTGSEGAQTKPKYSNPARTSGWGGKLAFPSGFESKSGITSADFK